MFEDVLNYVPFYYFTIFIHYLLPFGRSYFFLFNRFETVIFTLFNIVVIIITYKR